MHYFHIFNFLFTIILIYSILHLISFILFLIIFTIKLFYQIFIEDSFYLSRLKFVRIWKIIMRLFNLTIMSILISFKINQWNFTFSEQFLWIKKTLIWNKKSACIASIFSLRASRSVLFKPRASRSILYYSHTFKFISCNFMLKLKASLEYSRCELHFLKVTTFVFSFKCKRKLHLLKAL